MRNPGKGRLLTFEPSSGNWRKNLGTDIRNGSVKRYPIIGIPFGLRPHSIPIMGNDTVNGILPELPVLKAMRTGISDFLSFFYDEPNLKIEVTRKTQEDSDFPIVHRGNILVDFGDQKKPVLLSQLSSGEKMVFFIVADIARRLLILNKGNSKFEDHKGIVLIDEIGLHLHPRWQREILPALHHVFPNVQFICTTHSPQVLSQLRKENILQIDDMQIYFSSSDPKGGESGIILEEIFRTTRRPENAQHSIRKIYQLLESEDIDFKKVEEKIDKLKEIVDPDDPIFLQLGNYMERRKLVTS